MSKYRAKKTTINGITFDSQKEAYRYIELLDMEKAHKIRDLHLQVPFTIIDKSKWGREIKYVADFVYRTIDGKQVVEDVKGLRLPIYKLKRRMVAERYGFLIKEI